MVLHKLCSYARRQVKPSCRQHGAVRLPHTLPAVRSENYVQVDRQGLYTPGLRPDCQVWQPQTHSPVQREGEGQDTYGIARAVWVWHPPTRLRLPAALPEQQKCGPLVPLGASLRRTHRVWHPQTPVCRYVWLLCHHHQPKQQRRGLLVPLCASLGRTHRVVVPSAPT